VSAVHGCDHDHEHPKLLDGHAVIAGIGSSWLAPQRWRTGTADQVLSLIERLIRVLATCTDLRETPSRVESGQDPTLADSAIRHNRATDQPGTDPDRLRPPCATTGSQSGRTTRTTSRPVIFTCGETGSASVIRLMNRWRAASPTSAPQRRRGDVGTAAGRHDAADE
jgi:hypothetical protein